MHSPGKESKGNTSAEYIFATGGTNLGQGTYGLGPEGAKSATTVLMKNSREEFWKNQEIIIREWKQLEQERKAKLLVDSKKSTRARVEEALMERDAEIRKAAIQRKNADREVKLERDMEANARAQELLQEKKQSILQRQQAKEAAEVQKAREMAQARALREEMLQQSAEEREQNALYCIERGAMLRNMHEESRRRAKEEDVQRHEEHVQVVQKMHKKEEKRQTGILKIRSEIVACKADLVKNMRTTIRADVESALSKLDDEHCTVAAEQRKAIRNRTEERQRQEDQKNEEKRRYAQALRDEANQARIQNEETRKRVQATLHANMKQQREDARLQQEEETQLRKEEHQAYIKTMRELAGTRKAEKDLRAVSPAKATNKHKKGTDEE